MALLRTKLYDFQRPIARKAFHAGSYGLFMEQGTGKTITILHTVSRLAKYRGIRSIVVICPLIAIQTWIDQLDEHFLFNYEIAHDLENFIVCDDTIKFLIINPDQLIRRNQSAKDIRKRLTRINNLFDCAIVDESHIIKNRNSKRSRFIRRIETPYRYILTGTPIEKNPIDLWAQMRFLDRDTFHKWTKFRDEWTLPAGFMGKSFVIRKDLLPHFKKLVYERASRITKEEALDLPSITTVDLEIPGTPRLMELHDKMRDELIAWFNGDRMIATIALTKIIRMQQLTSGYFVGEEGTSWVDKTKLDYLINHIELHGSKSVVFSRFNNELFDIADRLEKLKYKVCRRFDKNKDDYREPWDVAVCQVKSAAMSIDLTAANIVYFFAHSYSFLDHSQAISRVHRHGQDKKVTIYNILLQSTIDKIINDVILDKRIHISEFLETASADIFQF